MLDCCSKSKQISRFEVIILTLCDDVSYYKRDEMRDKLD